MHKLLLLLLRQNYDYKIIFTVSIIISKLFLVKKNDSLIYAYYSVIKNKHKYKSMYVTEPTSKL